MLSTLKVNQFAAIPYLETSALMTLHKKKIKLSTSKPNVIVGPNGSGKSALLTTLALRHLAFFTNRSAFDDQYVVGNDCRPWWTREREWGNDYEWLKGLECDSDNAPVLYYRPNHIPGNETSITHAMMTGYFEEAKAFGRLVDDKSSGQQAQAVMAKLLDAIDGKGLPTSYDYDSNWRFDRELKVFEHRIHTSDFQYQAEILKAKFQPEASAIPMILMDEPEQSLDALAEARLWSQIAKADGTRMQLVIATHSLYPLLHPEKFNLIESEKGFSAAVLKLMS